MLSKIADVMLNAIALTGSFVNTQRMLQEYVSNGYLQQPILADAVGA